MMKTLTEIHHKLRACRACVHMCGTPVHGLANMVDVMLVGQAPGPHEADRGKPFAHTAGKTLFKWLGTYTHLSELELRERIYFTAVARCYPGRNPKGSGDRVPSGAEIENCRPFLSAEVKLLKPRLILAVGKLAISEILGPALGKKSFKLSEVVGTKFYVNIYGHNCHVIALPHSSGVSRWYTSEEGKRLLDKALRLITL